jgi:hypothetical protein
MGIQRRRELVGGHRDAGFTGGTGSQVRTVLISVVVCAVVVACVLVVLRHLRQAQQAQPAVPARQAAAGAGGTASVLRRRNTQPQRQVHTDDALAARQVALDADEREARQCARGLRQAEQQLQRDQARVQDAVPPPRRPGRQVGAATCHELQHTAEVSFEQHHFNIAAAQFLLLLGGQRRVMQVDYYDNPVTRQSFRAKKAELQRLGANTAQTWVFHGTADGNVQRIMASGFVVGGGAVGIQNGAAYGNGVYSAMGPGTPMGFARGCNKVILAKGLRGRFQDVGNAQQDRNADSWRGGGPDWCIFRTGQQLLPVYVVHFR